MYWSLDHPSWKQKLKLNSASLYASNKANPTDRTHFVLFVVIIEWFLLFVRQRHRRSASLCKFGVYCARDKQTQELPKYRKFRCNRITHMCWNVTDNSIQHFQNRIDSLSVETKLTSCRKCGETAKTNFIVFPMNFVPNATHSTCMSDHKKLIDFA